MQMEDSVKLHHRSSTRAVRLRKRFTTMSLPPTFPECSETSVLDHTQSYVLLDVWVMHQKESMYPSDPSFGKTISLFISKGNFTKSTCMFSGLFDQIIHSTENVDISGLFKHLYPKVMVGLPLLDGINPASCFPRTAIGYEATCYSRIWSEVFAADIFASKFRDNIFNQRAGLQFRNKVLAPGGAKEPLEMLSDFLGREPSIQAFLESRADSN